MTYERKPKASRPLHIIVGVEETGVADHAVRRGLELGRRLGARVDLVHAVPLMPGPGARVYVRRRSDRGLGILARASNVVNGRLRPLLAHANAVRNGHSSRARVARAMRRAKSLVRVVRGDPAKIILDATRGKKSAWVVLGRHRKRDFLDFGNTLRTVFARSKAPVWVQTRPVRPIRKILVPVDLSEESLLALATACTLARAFEARVRAVEYFHSGTFAFAGAGGATLYGAPLALGRTRKAEKSAFERAMKRFAWGGVEHTTDYRNGEPVTEILKASREADLVVLGSRGRTGLASVLLGGTAFSVLQQSKKPVLVVRAQARKSRVR